jgi:hypothetical protein
MLTVTDFREILQIQRQFKGLRREWERTKRYYYARKAGFRPDQPRDDHGRWSGGAGTQTSVINNSQTGISTIDNTTDDLLETLANVVDFLPEGSGPLYGIAVHGIFGNLVRFGNFPGIGTGDVETTYGGDGSYGSLGSIRTDVTLRNDIGDPIAIYDVKTGDAALTPARVKELRDNVGAGSSIPVIELHIRRGVTVKGRASFASYSAVIARRQKFPWIGAF